MKFNFTKTLIVAGVLTCAGLFAFWMPMQTAAAGAGATALDNLQTVESAPVSIAAGSYKSVQVYCPSGKKVIGTGFYNSLTDVAFVKGYTYFVGGFFWNNSSITIDVHVQAICASDSKMTSPSASDANKEFDRDVRQTIDHMVSW